MSPFELHGDYSKPEAGAKVGLSYGAPAWRKGIFWYGESRHILLFVTLVKAGLPFEYHYADRFLSPDEFYWQSQTQNSQDAGTGQKILLHEAEDRDVHLFVRAQAGSRFTYLGACVFGGWTGNNPFSVWWKLKERVPHRFHIPFAVPPAQVAPSDPNATASRELAPDETILAREIESQLALKDYSAPDTWGMARQRVGGKVFRRDVLDNFGGACCVDGLDVRDLLDAAHIHSWSEAPAERLDPANGVALCTLHHRAFDSGLMHFQPGGIIAIADPVRASKNPATRTHLLQYHNEKISTPRKFPTFLHR